MENLRKLLRELGKTCVPPDLVEAAIKDLNKLVPPKPAK